MIFFIMRRGLVPAEQREGTGDRHQAPPGTDLPRHSQTYRMTDTSLFFLSVFVFFVV